MSIQWKSTFIIIATLLIGIVIGVFLAGAVLHHRVRPPLADRGPSMFTPMLERIIQPTPDQEEAVHAVLEKHSSRLEGMHEDFRAEMVATMDSLKKDLDPILTDEQKARLDERHGHLKDVMKGRPGPGGRRRERPHRKDSGD